MSHIDDLINELASKGVPFKTLSELGTITRGKRFVKSDIVESGTPCIHYGEIYMRYGISATKTFSYLTPEQAARLRSAHPGDVIIASAGETVKDIGKAVAWLGDEDVVIHDACYAFRSKLEPKYVVYFSQTDDFHDQIRRYISSSKISAISIENLGKVRIPVPPVQVQQQIVRILDSFSELKLELENNLVGELEARQAQHAHYVDSLLLLADEGAHQTSLGSAVSLIIDHRGKTPKKLGGDWTDGGHRVISAFNIKNGQVDDNDHHYISHSMYQKWMREPLRARDVLLTSEAPLGAVAYVGEDVNWAIGQRLFALRANPELLDGRFLFHLLRAGNPRVELLARATGSTVSGIRQSELVKLRLVLPSIDEQKQIVESLDEIDALFEDLSAALPAELTARRKQYKYYRDRLLTFKELAAA